MGDSLIITIEAYGFLTENFTGWENSGLSLVEIIGDKKFPLCDDELRVLCESLEEIKPIKNERWHKLILERIYEPGGYSEPDVCYYSARNIELIPHRCLCCGRFIEKKESEKIDEAGVDPYCSQYCFEVNNGTQMPISRGGLIFDKWHNDR